MLQNIDANTKMTDLGAHQRALEEELARTTGERDIQRVAAEQKAQEAETQTAELQHVRTVLEKKEAELQRKKATVATLTGTLKEKENSLSSLEEAARVQREEAQKNIPGGCSKFRCRWVLVFCSLSWFL